MRWNSLPSTLALGLACAVLIGTGSLLLGPRTNAAGPPTGLDVRVTNPENNPVPVAGVVGCEQVGDWNVSLTNGISIDPGQNEVTIGNEVTVRKGTRRIVRFDLLLTADDPDQFFDIDTHESTKIRIAMTVNSSSSSRDVDVFLLSKVPGENNGSTLDEFETSSSLSSRVRLYELPGEELRFRAIMDDDDDDAFRQVIVTVWGD